MNVRVYTASMFAVACMTACGAARGHVRARASAAPMKPAPVVRKLDAPGPDASGNQQLFLFGWLPLVHCDPTGTRYTLPVLRATAADPSVGKVLKPWSGTSSSASNTVTVFVHEPVGPKQGYGYEVAWALRDDAGTFSAVSKVTPFLFENPDPFEEWFELELISRWGVLFERRADEAGSVLLWAAPGAPLVRLDSLPCKPVEATSDGFICIDESRFMRVARNGRVLESAHIARGLSVALPVSLDGAWASVDFARGEARVHPRGQPPKTVSFTTLSPPPLCRGPAPATALAFETSMRWAGPADLAQWFPPIEESGEAQDAIATIEFDSGHLCVRSLDVGALHAIVTANGIGGWGWINQGEGKEFTPIVCSPSSELPPGD